MKKRYVSLKPGDEVLCPEGHLTITGKTRNGYIVDKYYWEPTDEGDYMPVLTEPHQTLTEYELIDLIDDSRPGEPRYDKISWEE